ncbi:MAG TPA: hypothetical protein VGL03_03960 [Thermoanaerobaculia bacterium]
MRSRLSLLAALLLAATPLLGDDGRFEKTIAFPRSGDQKLDWTHQRCTIRSVQVRNYPDSEDIEKARQRDPSDKSWLWWEFHIDNRGDRDCKVKLWIEVLDKNGKVVKADDRSGTVDAGKIDDAIRVSGRMRTIDAADSPKVRVRGEIIPK